MFHRNLKTNYQIQLTNLFLCILLYNFVKHNKQIIKTIKQLNKQLKKSKMGQSKISQEKLCHLNNNKNDFDLISDPPKK